MVYIFIGYKKGICIEVNVALHCYCKLSESYSIDVIFLKLKFLKKIVLNHLLVMIYVLQF